VTVTIPLLTPIRVPFQVLQVRSKVTGPLDNASSWATWSGLSAWAVSSNPQAPVDSMEIPIAVIHEGESPVFVARVIAPNGIAPLTADIEQVELAIFDEDATTSNTAILTDDYQVSDVWFDTMQKDQYWRGDLGDGGGYNLRVPIDQDDAFPEGGRQYLVEVRVTSTTWGQLVRQGRVATRVVKDADA